jgi:hypothetical protein
VKGYAVTKAELWTLGGIQAGAAICFSLAGSCFGFWTSVKQQLDFSKGSDPALAGYWAGVSDVAFYGMIGLAVMGLVLFAISGLNAVNIIRGTRHD